MAQPHGSDSQTVSDEDRHKLEEEIAAALLLIYGGRRSQALAALGVTAAAGNVPLAAQHKILDFATLRAQKIQDGTNSRMAGSDDQQQTQSEIADHNRDVLQPFLASWALHQALLDAYRDTPDPNGSGTSAADATPWVWTQTTDYDDDCKEAMAASPAPLADLLSITGGPPPAHDRCQCDLYPA